MKKFPNQKVKRNLDQVIKISKSTLDIIKEDNNIHIEDRQLKIFLKLMIERMYQSTKAVKKMIIHFKRDGELEYPISQILRTQLMDTIISLQLIIRLNKIANTSDNLILEKELNSSAEGFLADGISKIIKISQQLNSSKLLNDKELKLLYYTIKVDCHDYLEDNALKVNAPPILKKDIAESIKKNKIANYSKDILQDENIKKLAGIIHMYELYSKYTHFGIYSKIVSENHLEIKQQRVIDCIEFNIYHCLLLHQIASETFNQLPILKDNLQDIRAYIKNVGNT